MKSLLLSTVCFLALLTACSSVRVDRSYLKANTAPFTSNKLLIVGMTSEVCLRDAFETSLQQEFSKRGIETEKSINLFDVDFTNSERSEKELEQMEQRLLEKGFDAILFTKVVNSETKTTVRQKVTDIEGDYNSFSEDYMAHQGIYFDRSTYEKTTDYYTETSLYCICTTEKIDLIWRSGYHVSNPGSSDRVVKDYVKVLIPQLEKDSLLINSPELSSQ